MSEPLRFLYLHPVALPGPEANLVQTAETCRALAERGHEVFLLVPKMKAATAAEGLRMLGVAPHERLFVVEEPSIRLKNPGRVRSVFVRAALVAYLRALVRRPRTVLWFRTLRDARLARFVLLAGRLLRLPVVYEAHKLYTEKRQEQGFGGGTLERYGRLEAKVFRAATGIVASHPLLGERLEKEFFAGTRARGKARLATIQNGVPLLEPAAGAKRFDAIYAGSLFPWKGVDVCIRAIAKLDGATLAIAGGNPPERLVELERLAKDLGVAERVTFLGQVRRDEALARLREARVALVPIDPGSGEGEAFTCPLKLLEAMMCGVPVVAADTPALRCFVTDGESALLAARGEPDTLAAAVARLLAQPDLARRLAHNARERALTMTFAERARSIEEFVRTLLA